MGDHFTTQYNHKRIVVERVKEVFYWVQHCHKTHGEQLEMMRERVYDHNSYQRLTRYNRSYVSGIYDMLQAGLYQNHLDWRVYHPDFGHLRKENYDQIEGKWSEVIGDMGAKFWTDTDDKIYSGEPCSFALYEDEETVTE